MIDRAKIAGLSLALALGLLPGLVGPVAAAGTGPLPPFKFAASARFDLTGSVTVGPSVLNLTGPGMLAGDRFQQDLTATPAGGGAAVTLNQIQVGSNYYFKLTGNPQWQMIDLSRTPGNVPNIQSNIPGLNGFNPNGGQRTYEAAKQAQAMGTETINGAATTKYQADVDVAALYTSLGTPPAQAAQVAAVSQMTLTLWVGDADQILYQQRVTLHSKAPAPGGGLLDVVVDFTITYHDFGTAVTITAPSRRGALCAGCPRRPADRDAGGRSHAGDAHLGREQSWRGSAAAGAGRAVPGSGPVDAPGALVPALGAQGSAAAGGRRRRNTARFYAAGSFAVQAGDEA